jgi:hypothetical protein
VDRRELCVERGAGALGTTTSEAVVRLRREDVVQQRVKLGELEEQRAADEQIADGDEQSTDHQHHLDLLHRPCGLVRLGRCLCHTPEDGRNSYAGAGVRQRDCTAP